MVGRRLHAVRADKTMRTLLREQGVLTLVAISQIRCFATEKYFNSLRNVLQEKGANNAGPTIFRSFFFILGMSERHTRL